MPIPQMNLGKVELDGILSVDGELRQEKVYEAFKEYLNVQKAMAASLGEYHPVRHRPSLAGGGGERRVPFRDLGNMS